MSATAPFRLARASAFAVVSVGLGVIAHVFAGGTVPAWGMAGGLALAFTAAFPMTGRERGLATILPLLGGGQAAFHLLFAATDSMAAHPGRPGLLPDLTTLITHPHSGLLPGLAMLVMHGWAVGLTALWLARGEALLWALLRRLDARLCRVLIVHAPAAYTSFFTPSTIEPEVLRSAVLRHAVSRRGPPRLVTAASN